MTREEAIKIVQSATVWTDEERDALAMLIPELAESEDEKNWKAVKEYIKDDALRSWLEKQKETGIRWLKSDNVKNPDKPYIDKAGMFYTTDGRMCYASEIEKQKDILSERATNITANMLEDRIEGIQRELIEFLSNTINAPWVDVIKSADAYAQRIKSMVEKQKEQKPIRTAKEMWEEMRLEVYAQASGNRHEPNYSDDSTKMFSLCDIDEIFEKIGDSTVGSKPAEWSDEDEEMLKDIISGIKAQKLLIFAHENQGKAQMNARIDWLQSLPERFNLQPKQEWSKEDEKVLEAVDESLYCYESGKAPEVVAQIEAERLWLKSLPLNLKKKNEDVAKLCSNEWSEEDEAHRAFILESLEDQIRFCKKDAEGAYYVKQIRTAQNWLKSLKIS